MIISPSGVQRTPIATPAMNECWFPTPSPSPMIRLPPQPPLSEPDDDQDGSESAAGSADSLLTAPVSPELLWKVCQPHLNEMFQALQHVLHHELQMRLEHAASKAQTSPQDRPAESKSFGTLNAMPSSSAGCEADVDETPFTCLFGSKTTMGPMSPIAGLVEPVQEEEVHNIWAPGGASPCWSPRPSLRVPSGGEASDSAGNFPQKVVGGMALRGAQLGVHLREPPGSLSKQSSPSTRDSEPPLAQPLQHARFRGSPSKQSSPSTLDSEPFAAGGAAASAVAEAGGAVSSARDADTSKQSVLGEVGKGAFAAALAGGQKPMFLVREQAARNATMSPLVPTTEPARHSPVLPTTDPEVTDIYDVTPSHFSRRRPEPRIEHRGSASSSAGGTPTAEKSVMVCRHWKSKGMCKLGNSCKFLHPDHKRGSGMAAVGSLPQRGGEGGAGTDEASPEEAGGRSRRAGRTRRGRPMSTFPSAPVSAAMVPGLVSFGTAAPPSEAATG